MFELINGTGRKIQDYTRYCNDNGFDAVVTQRLDLFSLHPLTETKNWSFRQSITAFDSYSLQCIDDFEYHDEAIDFAWFLNSNKVSNPQIKIKFGGIRKELFGENCALSKHALVKNTRHIKIYSHVHCSSNVSCADFTLLLRHYKFAGDYVARERQKIEAKTWLHGEGESRMAVIKAQSFAFSGKEVQRFAGTGPLVEQGFLTCSQAFLASFPPEKPESKPPRAAL